MAKYGTFKYGEKKYGATVDTGSGSITPSSGSINKFINISAGNGIVSIPGYLVKVIFGDVGEGIVSVSRSFAKKIIKLTGSASMTISGSINKFINISAGNGIVSIPGYLVKVIFGDVGEGIVSVSRSFAKKIIKLTGSASMTISGSINKFINISAGNGIVSVSRSFAKKIIKLTGSASMTISGSINKFINISAGNGIVSIPGYLVKVIFAKAGKAIITPIGAVAKRITKLSGQGSVYSSGGVIDKLKFYFLVTADMILQPLGLFVTKINRSLMPPTRDNTEEIPGRHGEIDFGAEFGSDMIELEVATDDGLSASEIESLKRTLAGKLNPAVGEKDLVLEYEMNKRYKVKYSGKIPIERYPSWFKFVLPFKILNPFAEGIAEKSLTGSGTITNEGTFETGLIIEISGPATNPSLTIGGVTLAYTGTINAGQKLVIDTEKQTAKIGSTNALAGYNGAFPMLQPGSVNVTAGSNVTIYWRDRWL